MEISSALQARILAHAASSPRVEVCGLLLGSGSRIDEVRYCRNVAAEPAAAFEIEPADLLAVHKAARSGGLSPIGCYHSHPNGRGEPSICDLAAAEVGSVWIIAASAELTAWRREEDGFVALAL